MQGGPGKAEGESDVATELSTAMTDVATELMTAMTSAQSALEHLRIRFELFQNAVAVAVEAEGDAQSSDRLSELNTKTSVLLHEAQDGEARVAALIADYKCLLKELRK